jgi:putative endonuclease
MLSSRSRVVLYVGVANSLEGRFWHHCNTAKDSFVKRYKLNRFVYFEVHNDIRAAIAREKQLKRWRRGKNDLVNGFNPK